MIITKTDLSKLVAVLACSDLLSEGFNFSEINPLLPGFPCYAMTFLLPYIYECREEILPTLLLHSL